jgi:predicted DNA-binding transcriptional regulator YafY
MRIQRLFSILDRLRARRHPVSAETLAEDLGVSLRTIYRDMVTLQSMGAPIRGEGGVGYQIEKGYFLPPLHFDADELDAIIIGMRLVAARGDKPLADAATRASAKISAVLPEDMEDSYYDAPLLAYSVQPKSEEETIDFLSPLRTALRDRALLHIEYLDLKGQLSERDIRPLGLTAFDKVWLLTSWCEKSDDFRSFRVDRLKAVERTGQTFRREPGKEFRDYLKRL